MSTKGNDFQSLLGKGNIRPIKKDETSPDYYLEKPIVSREKKQLAEHFEHSAVSRENYSIGIEDEMHYRAEGVQNKLVKQLAKGELTVYESIDLHGMTTMEAEVYMATTIDNQRYHHMTCIRIVHGKGYNVGDTPYDKPRYLTEHPRVLAFVSCPANRGGTGAVYVLLSRFDNA